MNSHDYFFNKTAFKSLERTDKPHEQVNYKNITTDAGKKIISYLSG